MTLPRRLERCADFFSSFLSSAASSIGTPALSLISAIGAATFGSCVAAAVRITFTLASCSAMSRRDNSHNFLITVIGEMRRTKSAVIQIKSTYTNAATPLSTSASMALLAISPIKPPVVLPSALFISPNSPANQTIIKKAANLTTNEIRLLSARKISTAM
ncbi:hypothetical protein D3C87_1445110 [compost metagenome]